MITRKLEITEELLKVGTVDYFKGDIKSFPKAEADEYVRLGWAKDVETGEVGERVPGARPINVQSVVTVAV